MASASRPRRAPSSASSSGCDAPSRNEKLECACSSAYGTVPFRRVTRASYGWRVCDHAGLSPPLAQFGRFAGLSPDSRRSSSRHGMAGLLKPTAGRYRTGVRFCNGYFFAMPYVEGRVVHDADAHIMETPNWLRDHADPAVRDRI